MINRHLSRSAAHDLGFSNDRRKCRHQHRQAAKNLINYGSLLSPKNLKGSTLYEVAQWHLQQARFP